MKSWRWCLPAILLAILLGLVGCTQGISQAEYDQVKSDLDAANSQIEKLQTDYDAIKTSYDKTKADLEAAQSQLKSLQSDYASATAEQEKAKSEVERLQELLNQASPYIRIIDLSIEQQRSEIGIKPKYWQYTDAYFTDEINKAVTDSKDATLQSLFSIYQQNPQGESRWFLYTIATATSILSGEGIPAVVLSTAPVVSTSPDGRSLLRVKMLQIDGTPIPNLEIDLWSANAPPGPPNAGVSTTDASGTAVFAVGAGDYHIGFNGSNFPAAYIMTSGRWAQVQAGMTTDIEIRLFKKE